MNEMFHNHFSTLKLQHTRRTIDVFLPEYNNSKVLVYYTHDMDSQWRYHIPIHQIAKSF